MDKEDRGHSRFLCRSDKVRFRLGAAVDAEEDADGDSDENKQRDDERDNRKTTNFAGFAFGGVEG